MRWAFLSCVAMLAGCAPPERAEQGVTRQAFLSTPDSVGTVAGAHLGASLAPCPTSGFVAGAPGNGSVLLSPPGGTPLVGVGTLGTVVACDGLPGSLRIIAGGTTGGLFRYSDGGWAPFTTESAVALSRSEFSSSLPLLVGEPGRTIRFIDHSTLSQVGARFDGGLAGFGAALTWFPDRPRFVVGAPSSQQVFIYDYDGDGGVTHVGQIANPMVANFGRTVAVGDVSPRPGLEIIIGSAGSVFIYQQDGTLVQRLEGADSSFGASLALERAALSGTPDLDALWVGEPGLDQVYRFVGDAGVTSAVPLLMGPHILFGATLSIDAARKLTVGAPNFDATQVGAVFTQPLLGTALGEAMECTNNTACATSTCDVGQCVGGVFCSGFDSYNCLSGETCSAGVCLLDDGGVARPDAGTDADSGVAMMDAGSTVGADGGMAGDAGLPPVDAGTRTDAGLPEFDSGVPEADAGREADAGSADAGSRDAGSDAGTTDAGSVDGGEDPGTTLVFKTCGCDGGVAMPLLLLGLVLARRRARR